MDNKDVYKVPVLLGVPDGDGGLIVWCPWCVDWHRHGHIEGFRVAHCGKGTPWCGRQYSISAFTEEEMERMNSYFACAKKANGTGNSPYRPKDAYMDGEGKHVAPPTIQA